MMLGFWRFTGMLEVSPFVLLLLSSKSRGHAFRVGAMQMTSTAPGSTASTAVPSSVYINLPFCRRRCFYCDFPIKVCDSYWYACARARAYGQYAHATNPLTCRKIKKTRCARASYNMQRILSLWSINVLYYDTSTAVYIYRT